jgi:hypothetical protein
MTEDIIKTLTAERTFLQAQNHKLATIIRQQEEQIMDLRLANQDLKFQLSERTIEERARKV